MSAHTCFGGTLVRYGPDDWRWVDGTPAVGVHDQSLNSHNFRVVAGDVLVPERAARDAYNPELSFVAERLNAGVYRRHPTRRGIILVPLADWDEQAKEPIGATWPAEIEHYVLDYAQDLGWDWRGERAESITRR